MGTANRFPGTSFSDTPPFPAYNDAIYLTDGNAKSWTVPTKISVVIISSNGDCWVRQDGTAAVPSGDVTDGTAGVRIASGEALQVRVGGGDTLSIIREDASATTVNLMCWAG